MSILGSEPEAPIHVPTVESCEDSHLSRFIRYCEEQVGKKFANYASFDAFSTAEWRMFWKLFLRWSAIKYDGDVEPTCSGTSCEDAVFFPNVSLNYAETLLESNRASDRPAVTAFHGDRDRDTLTGAELHNRVVRLASALRQFGVQPGERVVAIARNGLEAVVAALATIAVGGVFASCAPDMGAEAILSRFNPLRPVALVASVRAIIGDTGAPVAARVFEVASSMRSINHIIALDDGDLAAVANVVVHRYSDLISATADKEFRWVRFPFNHPVFIMFSSGTTGLPKCIIHGAGGTLLEHMKEHLLHCDMKPGDKLFFQTSCAWMMWNWQLSSLASGCEIVLFDGHVTSPETLWDIASKANVTILGTSPSYLQLCAKAGFSPRNHCDLGALRSVLSTGSILADALYDWVRTHVKSLPLQSISGGTDILGCFVLGNPILPVFRGQAQCRSLGLDVRSLARAGEPEEGPGDLVCTNPFPSRPLGLFGDEGGSRFHEAYFAKNPSVWTHGDIIEFTQQGGARIHGRSDGVLNIRGIRIGPAEIYSILGTVDSLVEAMAVEQEVESDPGSARLLLLVVLRDGVTLDNHLAKQIRFTLAARGSASFVPGLIVQVDELPMTLNGKRSEVAARDAVNGNRPRNFEALSNPDVIPAIRRAVQEMTSTAEIAVTSARVNMDSERGVVKTIDQLRAKVLRAFEHALGRTLDPADNSIEMGVDSLQMITVFVELERALGIRLPDEDFASLSINALTVMIWQGLSAGEHRARPDSPQVRAATSADADAIARLLDEGFGRDDIEPRDWRVLLTYEWCRDKPNLGFVLTVDDTIIGFVGTVYSRRNLMGKPVVICNLSCWFVMPAYRGWGALLLRAALQDETVSYTSLTPGTEAGFIFCALGFESLERRKLLLLPFMQSKTLLNGRPQLEFQCDRIGALLSSADRRIFDDHQAYDCLHLVVRDGPNNAYLVVKKRPFHRASLKSIAIPQLSYSEILYCSAPRLLLRHLERIKLSVMRRQRTIAVLAAEQTLGSPLPHGRHRKQQEFYRSPDLSADCFDMLYSELVLLTL